MVLGGVNLKGCTDLLAIRNGKIDDVMCRRDVIEDIILLWDGAVVPNFVPMDVNDGPHIARVVNYFWRSITLKEWINQEYLWT